MSSIAKRLDVHFTALAAVGAASAVGAVAHQAHADIVYSGVVNVPIAADFYGVYINFSSGAHSQSSSTTPGWDFNPYQGPSFYFGGGGMEGVSPTAGDTISALNVGDVIGPAQAYSTSDDASSFNSTTPRIMGFTFVGDDSLQHYGWVRFTMCDGDVTPGNIIDYGYESNTGVAITAGAVPAPAAGMGLLALGGAGLLGRRRK